MKTTSIIAACLAATLTAAAPMTAANATGFFSWEVTDVSFGDVLNVRRWPSTQSQIRSAYPNGTVLSMTGKCKDAPNMLDEIAHLPAWQQRQAVRYKWCEVWHDPANNGEYEPGWIYMKYAKPNGS